MGIPPSNTNPEKPQVITSFIEGVWTSGDRGTIVCDYDPIDVDVAVVQGFVHPGSKNSLHLNLRKEVFEYQTRRNKRSIIIDSNLFLAYDKGNSKKFLRYSYDGIFPTTGEYCNNTPDPHRWELISKKLGIKLKPESKKGNYVLICCQRDGGWSMDNKSLMSWLVATIQRIRKYSERTILVRFHPGDRNIINHKKMLIKYRIPNVKISNSENFLQDLHNAWAVVNHNSSPGVVAAIEGIPVFLTDCDRSQSKDVAHNDFSLIETPKYFDREKWIHKMAQMHWSLDELKNGTAWKHLRKWAIKT